jgi:hypothetical protein
MSDGRSPPVTPRRRTRKRLTDPFQIFCVENRPVLAAQHPTEPVGSITSRLAKMWRDMDNDQKVPFVDLARKFDQVQAETRRAENSREPPKPKPRLPLLMLSIVRRGESSVGAELASRDFVLHPTNAETLSFSLLAVRSKVSDSLFGLFLEAPSDMIGLHTN